MSKRFASDVNVDDLLASKYAKSTVSFDVFTQRLLDEYILEKNVAVNYADPSALDEILCGFYSSIRKKDGVHYSLTTFSAIRHSISRVLKQKNDLEILKDKSFSRSNSVFEGMLKEIKKSGHGAVKHYPVICDQDLETIACWKWQIPQELQWKAWFTLHFHSIMRGRENLHDLKKDDIVFAKERNKFVAYLKDMKTKNHQKDTAKSHGGIIFATEEEDCPVSLLKFYVSKLSKENDYLWQRPTQSYISKKENWFKGKIGVNTVNTFMRSLSRHLTLTQEYTNHCVRATAITILGRDFQDLDVACFSGHKSLNALGIYKRVSQECKEKMSNKLHDSISTSSPHNLVSEMPHLEPEQYLPSSSTTSLVAQNVSVDQHSHMTMPTIAQPMESPSNLPQLDLNDDDFSSILEDPTIRALIDGPTHSSVEQSTRAPLGFNLNYKCNVAMHFHIHK
jgi:hypothetical protein